MFAGVQDVSSFSLRAPRVQIARVHIAWAKLQPSWPAKDYWQTMLPRRGGALKRNGAPRLEADCMRRARVGERMAVGSGGGGGGAELWLFPLQVSRVTC